MPEPATSLTVTASVTPPSSCGAPAFPSRGGEAVRIWSELRGGPRPMACWDGHRPIPPSQAADSRAAASSAATAGEPLAHVTGWAGFRHLVLRSDRRALIPRPETEGLVDLLLHGSDPGGGADIGTGTGASR